MNGCRTLFATHYHELTALREDLDRLSCHSMKVREWEGEIIFLAPGHRRCRGSLLRRACGASCRTAGSGDRARADPAGGNGIGRPRRDRFRTARRRPTSRSTATFSRRRPPTSPPEDDRLRDRLGEINPDMLAPRDALELLYELRELLDLAPTVSVRGDNE